MPATKKQRLQILKADEIDALYCLPTFNQTEREEYFALDDKLLRYVRSLSRLETQYYFVLYLGYFRAKPVVPQFHLTQVRSDIQYLSQRYFSGKKPQQVSLAKATKSRVINQVLAQLEFSTLTPKHSAALQSRLFDVATIYSDPRYLLDEALAFFSQQRIALPGYSTLQSLVTTVLSSERQRTEDIMSKNLSVEAVQALQSIMENKGELSNLSEYRGSARGFASSELERELSTHQTLQRLYPTLKALLSLLQLSRGNMIYYASLVKHRSLYKLRRTPKWQGLLYLVCYLYFRYRENNDRLVTAFCYRVEKHREAAKAYARQRVADDLEVVRTKLKEAGSILRLFTDHDIEDSLSFGEVRQRAFSLLEASDLDRVSQHLCQSELDLRDYQWQYVDQHARKTGKMLRKLFIAIDIETLQPALTEQIIVAKRELTRHSSMQTMNESLIPPREQPYIAQDTPDPLRFEHYLYQRIATYIESGQVYVTESEKNRRLEDDLIPSDTWRADKASLIEKTGLTRLATPIAETLSQLEERFQTLLKRVTLNIKADANEFVKCQPRSNQLTWSLANRRWKTAIDNPVYNQLQHKGIIEVMRYVSRKTDYLSAFSAIASRKKTVKANDEDLIACLFGNGANYGLHHIASVSDRSVGSLRAVNDSYIRPETTQAANDLISNATAKLPIFKYYTINEQAPFGSIDGQKHACRINTFKARFSAKYFRKGKGVSALTLVVNHVPVNTTVNAPNEYEAHFAFDLLYNNSSEIQPSSVATDTHGVNSVNFALLDIFGYQFSPRYARFKRIFEGLFDVSVTPELDITLKKPIKRKLIEQEWDNIQHIVCSLSRKSTSQSTVVKKLANSKRSTRTLQALREYDRLIKCIYVLEYVDNQTLRQFVQQALNRGEAYHQLRRAIASVNGNQFRGGHDYQIEQWNDCARLIANCIIYYNSALLSGLVQRFEEKGNQTVIDLLANLSPVAWSHIQLAGNYTFADEQNTLNLEALLEDVNPLSEGTLGDDEDV